MEDVGARTKSLGIRAMQTFQVKIPNYQLNYQIYPNVSKLLLRQGFSSLTNGPVDGGWWWWGGGGGAVGVGAGKSFDKIKNMAEKTRAGVCF